MAGFVFAHFVHRVVDGVVPEFFRPLCEHKFAFRRPALRFNAQFEVLFRVGADAFAEEFGELRRVFGLFKRDSLVCFRDFRISLPVGLPAHRQIHSDFCALAREIRAQPFDDFLVEAGGDADFVFIGPRGGGGVVLDGEFGFGRLALGADVGEVVGRL